MCLCVCVCVLARILIWIMILMFDFFSSHFHTDIALALGALVAAGRHSRFSRSRVVATVVGLNPLETLLARPLESREASESREA